MDRKRKTAEDWAEQNRVGRERAAELIERMRAMDNPTHLAHQAADLFGVRDVDGVAVGFFHQMAVAAMRGGAA